MIDHLAKIGRGPSGRKSHIYSTLLIGAAIAVACVGVGGLAAHYGTSYSLVSGPTLGAILTWSGAAILAALAWRSLRSRSSVALLLVYGFLVFGILAALLYLPTSNELEGSRSVVAHIAQHTEGVQYLQIFLAAAFALWCGGLIITLIAPRRRERWDPSLALRIPVGALALATIPLIAYLYGIGLHPFFHAHHYLERSGPAPAVSLGQALGPVAVLISGYFAFHSRQSVAVRIFALALALGYEMLYLAISSRAFGLWPALILIGGMLTGTWNTRQIRVGSLVAIIAAALLVQVPITLRELPQHGLLPAVTYIATEPSQVFDTSDPANNVLFGAPLTYYVGNNVPPIPTGSMITSISPAPSSLNDWGAIKRHLRVNFVIPYSALGELLNRGWLVFLAGLAAIGAAFTLIERLVVHQKGMVAGLSNIVVLGAAALFIIQSTEYNLRSGCRLIYYSFVIVVALRVIFPQAVQTRSRMTSPPQRLVTSSRI